MRPCSPSRHLHGACIQIVVLKLRSPRIRVFNKPKRHLRGYATDQEICCIQQAELAIGRVDIQPLQNEDLRAASIVLIRSFATAPDSVTVSLTNADSFMRKWQNPERRGKIMVARLFPQDPSLLPPERSYRIVGTAAVTFAEEEDPRDKAGLPQLPSDAAHVASIAVDQKVRQQGVAGLLLAACEEHARACGFKAISLAVHNGNAPARQLYVKHGYKDAPRPFNLQSVLQRQRSPMTVMTKEL